MRTYLSTLATKKFPLILFSLAALAGASLLFSAPALSQSTSPITGWAWSDNIGWISLHCSKGGPTGNNICATSNYGLTLNTNSTVTGYAWSDNIGWVQFGGLSGFPGGVTYNTNAKFVNNALVGWARAIANGGGWDGWIYLGGTGHNGGGFSDFSGFLSGYIWGSDVVGWLQLQGSLTPLCAGTAGYICTDPTHSQYTDAWCVADAPVFCQYGCSSSTGQCITTPPPSGCLSVNTLSPCTDRGRVRSGTTATLYWDIQNAASCSIAGNGQSWPNVAIPSGSQVTSAITKSTSYKITCTALDSSTFTDSVIINITPVFREI